jgi:DUF1680 family protein
MTETEANWNWFGRPSWTEPCAIVDSCLLTMELWRVTASPQYLNDAHRIFYNGLGYGQKPGGGFGCDLLTAMDGLGTSNRHWDVPWCCNMRGAVGLAAGLQSHAEWRADTLILPFYTDGALSGGGWTITEQTGWPINGEITLRFRRAGDQPRTVQRASFFVPTVSPPASIKPSINGQEIPAQFSDGFITVPFPQTDSFEVRVQMDLPLRTEPTHNLASRKDVVSIRHGFLVLGTPDNQRLASVRLQDLQPLGQGRYRVGVDGPVLVPISQMPFSSYTEQSPWRAQVLFQLGH